MKQSYDATGVAAKETELFQLNDAALQTELLLMQADFKSWMLANFQLSSEQEGQLLSLPSLFVTELGNKLSSVWSKRIAVDFSIVPIAQRTYSEDPPPTHNKDVLLKHIVEAQQVVGEEEPVFTESLTITINQG